MEDASSKISKALIIFICAVIFIKYMTGSGFFEPTSHSGRGYSVAIPEGWKRVKKQKDVVYADGVDMVLFVPKETDVKTEEPETYISIFTKKLNSPIWIDDEFPSILDSIARNGNQIMDQGQIKIDDVVSRWAVYYDKKPDAFFLEFYMVTDSNLFCKIQYSAPPNIFNKLRPSFEELKDSFRFKFGLY